MAERLEKLAEAIHTTLFVDPSTGQVRQGSEVAMHGTAPEHQMTHSLGSTNPAGTQPHMFPSPRALTLTTPGPAVTWGHPSVLIG